MFKQSLTTLFLCLCFGAFSCTSKSEGFFAEDGGGTGFVPGLPPVSANPSGTNGGPAIPNTPNIPDAPNPNSGSGGGNPPEPVPEPMTMLLFGSGLAGVAYRYRRKEEDKEEDVQD